eukprot:770096_1
MDASIGEYHADLAHEKLCMIKVTRSFATLQYKLATIDISIESTNGKISLQSLSPNTTIQCVKRMISQQENIPIQYLVLRTDIEILANDTLLRTILADDHSRVLVLELRTMRIRIDGAPSLPLINTLTAWHTFKDVKNVIEKETGVPCHLQCLRSVGEICDDNTHLLGCDQLDLTVTPITIEIRSAKFGTTFGELSVLVTATIRGVKAMIKDRFQVNVERLVVQGDSGMEELHDLDDDGFYNNNLLSFGIEYDNTMYFSCKRDCVFMFWSPPGGDLLSFELHPQDQIKDLKYELMCRFGSTHFTQPHRQVSIFTEFEDDGLEDEDCVQHYDLCEFWVDIAVFIAGLNDIDHTRHAMYCPQFSAGATIKMMLYRHKQIAVASQILLFDEKELNDHDRLDCCGIKDGSEIRLQVREPTPALSTSASIASMITNVHDQQNQETCWAFALATVFRASLHKYGNIPPKHEAIVSELVGRYGNKGVDVYAVLRKECPLRQLRYGV